MPPLRQALPDGLCEVGIFPESSGPESCGTFQAPFRQAQFGSACDDGDGVLIAAGAGADAPLTLQRITQAGVAQWSRTLAVNSSVTGLLSRGPGSALVVGAHVSQAGTIPAIAATSDQGVLFTDLQLQVACP